MKPGFKPGLSTKCDTVVTEEMLPRLDGAIVFPVISTSGVAALMEVAGEQTAGLMPLRPFPKLGGRTKRRRKKRATMRPRSTSLSVCVWVLLLASATGFAQESRPAVEMIPLKPLPVGSARFYFFEHTLTGRPVGYSEMSLILQKEKGKREYRYRHTVDIKYAGRRTTTAMEARLTPGFIPREVKFSQTVAERQGDKSTTEHVAVIEADGIVLTKTENGKTETRRVPLPPVEFVYGLAMLIERIDYEKTQNFSVAELDPKNGTAFVFTFSSEVGSDNVRTVTGTWGVKGRSWYFTLDAEGDLNGWGQFPPEVTAKRTHLQRVEELRESLGLD